MGPRIVSAAAAAVVLATGPAVFAEEPPIIVLDAEVAGSASHTAAGAALRSVATRRGTVVIDLSAAQSPEPKASGLLERAKDAYHDFDYDRALELLDEAIGDAESTGAAGLIPAQLSDLHLFRALSHTQKSDSAAAWSDLVFAAALDPSRVLDSLQFPPRVIEAFGRAVEAVRKDGSVSVSLRLPEACSAWIDARPAQLREPVSLARGEHYVRADCKGYRPYGARKLLSADARLEPSLVELPAPSLTRAIAEAKSRGASTVMWARETSTSTGTTLTIQVADVATAKVRGSVIARPDDAHLPDAVDKLIADVVDNKDEIRIVEPLRPKQSTPWYKRPWVWGVVGGAAVATAVLLPFVLDASDPKSFDIGVGGDTP